MVDRRELVVLVTNWWLGARILGVERDMAKVDGPLTLSVMGAVDEWTGLDGCSRRDVRPLDVGPPGLPPLRPQHSHGGAVEVVMGGTWRHVAVGDMAVVEPSGELGVGAKCLTLGGAPILPDSRATDLEMLVVWFYRRRCWNARVEPSKIYYWPCGTRSRMIKSVLPDSSSPRIPVVRPPPNPHTHPAAQAPESQ